MNTSAHCRIVILVTALLAAGSSTQGARLALKDAASTSRSSVLQVAKPAGQPVAKLDHPQLRFRVAEAVGEIFICGPYHVTREWYEREVAAFPEIQRNAELVDWIRRRLGLTGKVDLSDREKTSVYEQYRRLSSILLEKSGNAYRFRVRAMDRAHPVKHTSLFLVSGLIDSDGRLSIQDREPVFYPHCPK